LTLKRLASVCSSFLRASLFLDLYLVIPLASSNTLRLSSGLELKRRSSFPCSIKK